MHFFGPILGTLAVVEMLLYFGAPRWYSLAARFPLGPTRRLVIQPRARDALRAAPRDAGYRDSALGRVDLGKLELPENLETDGFVLHFHAARGFALARFPYTLSTRLFAMARVDLRDVDGGLELRPRFVILGWPTFFGLAPVAAAFVFVTKPATEWPSTFVMGALFLGINVVLSILFGRGRLETGVNEIERQIQAALVSAETDR